MSPPRSELQVSEFIRTGDSTPFPERSLASCAHWDTLGTLRFTFNRQGFTSGQGTRTPRGHGTHSLSPDTALLAGPGIWQPTVVGINVHQNRLKGRQPWRGAVHVAASSRQILEASAQT